MLLIDTKRAAGPSLSFLALEGLDRGYALRASSNIYTPPHLHTVIAQESFWLL